MIHDPEPLTGALPDPSCGAVRGRNRDRGFSLVEIVVTIALLGIGAVATLTVLTAAIAGSDQHRKVVNAESWVQSAGDYLTSSVPRLPCWWPGATTLLPSFYESSLRSGLDNSDGWPTENLRVVPPVRYWNGTSFGSASTHCVELFGETGLRAQLVTLEVRSPDGKVVRELTVVKGS